MPYHPPLATRSRHAFLERCFALSICYRLSGRVRTLGVMSRWRCRADRTRLGAQRKPTIAPSNSEEEVS
jgi:hypothetical protein